MAKKETTEPVESLGVPPAGEATPENTNAPAESVPLQIVSVGQFKTGAHDGVFFAGELARALSFFKTATGTAWKVERTELPDGQTVVSIVEVKA